MKRYLSGKGQITWQSPKTAKIDNAALLEPRLHISLFAKGLVIFRTGFHTCKGNITNMTSSLLAFQVEHFTLTSALLYKGVYRK